MTLLSMGAPIASIAMEVLAVPVPVVVPVLVLALVVPADPASPRVVFQDLPRINREWCIPKAAPLDLALVYKVHLVPPSLEAAAPSLEAANLEAVAPNLEAAFTTLEAAVLTREAAAPTL